MHKKSTEAASSLSTGKCEAPRQPAPHRAEEAEVAAAAEAEKRSEGKSSISKEELRENSIAALRAKAQEHSAKVLGTVAHDRLPDGKQERQAAEEKSADALSPTREDQSP